MRDRNFLLDSHALLWGLGEKEKLGAEVKDLFKDNSCRLLISFGSLWELSIKVSVGKLTLPTGFFEKLPDLGFEYLSLNEHHLQAYRALPLIHRDPFDRLLVAQAQSEQIPLISNDPLISRYDVSVIW